MADVVRFFLALIAIILAAAGIELLEMARKWASRHFTRVSEQFPEAAGGALLIALAMFFAAAAGGWLP